MKKFSSSASGNPTERIAAMKIELTPDERDTLINILHTAAEMFASNAKICREPGVLTRRAYEATARSFEGRAATAAWFATHVEKNSE